jgi:chromate transport protein ChrA
MKDKCKFAIIFVLKTLSVIFMISAIISFIASIIYNVQNSNEDIETIVIFILANLSVTLFYRIVMAVFFFTFAMFIEEWLKTDETK